MQIDTENNVLTLETPDVMSAILYYCEEVLGIKIDASEDDGRRVPTVIDAEFEDDDKQFSVEFDLAISPDNGTIVLESRDRAASKTEK